MSLVRRTFSDPKVEAEWVRLDAGVARLFGIDVSQPGWRDKYLVVARMWEEHQAEQDRLIATPHVDEAIDRMEQQFEGGAVVS